MEPGLLNCRVTLERRLNTQDSLGQAVQTWQAVGPAWADIRLLSGLEAVKADTERAKVRGSIRIRYRTDVTAEMRIVHGSAVYGITAVLPDSSKRHVDLTVEQLK